MEEKSLRKDNSIIYIYNIIIARLGFDYFDPEDFWEDDLFAIGLKKALKLVYISTWDFRITNSEKDMNYYCEFEIIDEETLETRKIVDKFDKISTTEILFQIERFFKLE